MAARDSLGKQWNSGSEVMSRQLGNLFDLDDPEGDYEFGETSHMGLANIPKDSKSGTKVIGSKSNLPERAPDPNRGKFGRAGAPAPIPGNIVVDAIRTETQRVLGDEPADLR